MEQRVIQRIRFIVAPAAVAVAACSGDTVPAAFREIPQARSG